MEKQFKIWTHKPHSNSAKRHGNKTKSEPYRIGIKKTGLNIKFWAKGVTLWVDTSASRNTIISWNFQLEISAPFSGWNFWLKISELKFQAEIFLSRKFQLEKGAEIPSWNILESKFAAWKRWPDSAWKVSSKKRLKFSARFFRAEILGQNFSS